MGSLLHLNAKKLEEPELVFANGNHLDIKLGIQNLGPLVHRDCDESKGGIVGIVGLSRDIDAFEEWWGSACAGIVSSNIRLPRLFAPFPGVGDAELLPQIGLGQGRRIELSERDVAESIGNDKEANIVRKCVSLFSRAFHRLKERHPGVALVVCLLPEVIEDKFDEYIQASFRGARSQSRSLDQSHFRAALKAKAMTLGIASQLLRPSTYDNRSKKRKSSSGAGRRQQDPATRAWNLYVASYYKVFGSPWKLAADPQGYSTLFAGVGFYGSLDKSALETATTQVFNERGDGIVLRGPQVAFSKGNRRPFLSTENARELLNSAVEAFRDEHRAAPARVVLHKTSEFRDEEVKGFSRAADDHRIDMLDLVSIRRSPTLQCFRRGSYPVARGTFVKLAEDRGLLYGRGTVPYYGTYPGLRSPLPLDINVAKSDRSIEALAKEILALTKLNWNVAQFDGGMPITLVAARNVGDVLKHFPNGVDIASRYSYYM